MNALTTIGANVISATTAILDGCPNPSQSTAIGATATIGIELRAAAIGSAPARSNGTLTNSQAQRNPTVAPISSPTTASKPV